MRASVGSGTVRGRSNLWLEGPLIEVCLDSLDEETSTDEEDLNKTRHGAS